MVKLIPLIYKKLARNQNKRMVLSEIGERCVIIYIVDFQYKKERHSNVAPEEGKGLISLFFCFDWCLILSLRLFRNLGIRNR